MPTLHTAELLLPGAGLPPVRGGAVVLDGGVIEAVGPYGELAAAFPQARTRRWPGVLTPGLVHPGAAALLEDAYHPDPREADQLGTEPLSGPALAALAMDDTRWGGSARRGLQRLLACGVTAVVGPFRRAPVRTAVRRAGMVELRRPSPEGAAPVLDPLALVPPESAFAGTLAPGGRADLAAFALPAGADGSDPLAALRHAGAASCAATVLGGRLVHRTR
ncbi:hypothetical protein LHJ74_19800 [Streptomyces sp. N2-109]|uniref:Aminodeoxyfutalosine deaminase/Imidazolonepropionase-like composite domain-containing protein n=1 Tax=Streptomyces gossypii TaxID=2883101 RepID=A0ABT2JXR2_9ACTN|nr:hypothetical protein [Streptomyces gossypii]MCT2592120.1 hypothetical protein [Streptomyces gossypii]